MYQLVGCQLNWWAAGQFTIWLAALPAGRLPYQLALLPKTSYLEPVSKCMHVGIALWVHATACEYLSKAICCTCFTTILSSGHAPASRPMPDGHNDKRFADGLELADFRTAQRQIRQECWRQTELQKLHLTRILGIILRVMEMSAADWRRSATKAHFVF